ncbi:hypothetical protein D6833_09415 [Candidatus Parcubacteria bacterium]|nr:MAG: hypothetical protein D6833_09415 [Candidatus Parcubacteria bacterium]
MDYHQMYQALNRELHHRLPEASEAQLRNQALFTLALAYSPNCHLATLALRLPLPAKRENLVQRLRRWLDCPSVTQQRCYLPLVQQLFEQWPAREVSLVMDRTDIEDRWSLLMLAAAHEHRALPLAWRVLPFGGTDAQTQVELLQQVRPWLPNQVRVNFYGDAEFRAVPLQRACQAFQWHWQVGLKSDILFRLPSSDWKPLRSLNLSPGQRRYVHGITLTKEHAFGPVHLLADWNPNEPSPRYVVSDQLTNRHAWRRGRKRFWIEPFFRDWKSYGFDLERSKVVAPHRLEGLLLGMGTTTLWLAHIGQWLKRTGRSALVEAAHKRDYSLFRKARDYVFRSQVMHWPVPIGFDVS